jgi:predicted nucleic acid-binding protein
LRQGDGLVLVDTSIWSDHLRRGDKALAAMLSSGDVLMHPWVQGELACGLFPNRSEVLTLLARMPQAPVLGLAELLGFVERQGLAGRGVGLTDVQLLASARVAQVRLWTRDRRLASAAAGLGVAFAQ